MENQKCELKVVQQLLCNYLVATLKHRVENQELNIEVSGTIRAHTDIIKFECSGTTHNYDVTFINIDVQIGFIEDLPGL